MSNNDINFKRNKRVGYNELIRLVAAKAGTYSEVSAQKYIEAFIKVIADELLLCGEVSVPQFGVFRSTYREGYDRLLSEDFARGAPEWRYIEPTYKVKFKVSQVFIDALNGERTLLNDKDFLLNLDPLYKEAEDDNKFSAKAIEKQFIENYHRDKENAKLAKAEKQKKNKPKKKKKSTYQPVGKIRVIEKGKRLKGIKDE